MAKVNVFKFINKINEKSKTADSYNTGLVGEQLIVSAYEEMPLFKLEKLRIILNGIIKKKKELRRVKESESIKSSDNINSSD